MPLCEVDDEKTRAMSKWRPTNSKALEALVIIVSAKLGVEISDEMDILFGLLFDGWSHGTMHFIGVYALYVDGGRLRRTLLALSPMGYGNQDADARIEVLRIVMGVYNKTLNTNNDDELHTATSLRANKRNAMRWTSTISVLERYVDLRPHIRLGGGGDDVPTSGEYKHQGDMLCLLCKLGSVYRRQQCESTTMSESEAAALKGLDSGGGTFMRDENVKFKVVKMLQFASVLSRVGKQQFHESLESRRHDKMVPGVE
ncbi:Heat shock protein70 [Phytophthora cinnamomi]|uniref:Heat shock protein70 n=1 Tax=Phytophthora cinnamomi TaxID=4785 RepID=UPI00355A0FDE|nr:Heat shock protein70 [Phytophthora cinnamomi]